MSKLRSVGVFKKIAMRVEERKFDDITKLVVTQIMESPSLKKYSDKTDFRIKRLIERNFEELVETGVDELYQEKLNHFISISQIQPLKIKIMKFLESKMPSKSYEGLSFIKTTELSHCDDENLEFLLNSNTKEFKDTEQSLFKKSSGSGLEKKKPLEEPEPEILMTENKLLIDRDYHVPSEPEVFHSIKIPKTKKKPKTKLKTNFDEGSHKKPKMSKKPYLLDHELKNRIQSRKRREAKMMEKKREEKKKLNNMRKYFSFNVETLKTTKTKVAKFAHMFTKESPNTLNSFKIKFNKTGGTNFFSSGTLLSTDMETENANTIETVYNEVYDELLIDYLTNMDFQHLEVVVDEETESSELDTDSSYIEHDNSSDEMSEDFTVFNRKVEKGEMNHEKFCDLNEILNTCKGKSTVSRLKFKRMRSRWVEKLQEINGKLRKKTELLQKAFKEDNPFLGATLQNFNL